jgi:ribosomal protein S13
MDVNAPTVVYIPVSCAPMKAPCPHCGKLAKRLRTGEREVRTIAYRKIAYLRITYGEYQPRCGCCQSFRTSPEEVLPRCKYDHKVRQAVLDRILDDGMNVEATLRSLKRDFHLDLSTGFVYDCLHDAVAQLQMGEHREQVLAVFSGTLCVDELHLGKYTLLLATDPLRDIPVAFALVGANDKEHMGRFLKNLKNHGLEAQVVITDGSSLYPDLLAKLWPAAEHQLCVFHVMQDLNAKILDAVKRLRRSQSRRGHRGRKRRRGRPTKTQQRRRQQRQTQKDQAKFVFKHRYLIVKRRANMTELERKDLQTLLAYLPALQPLREFSDGLHRLLVENQSEHQAWCRLRAMQRQDQFLAVPELQAALRMLEDTQFRKMIAFLRSPASQRVRTNNHVERCNRKLRYWEKVRYKWRRRRTLVRFVVLALDHWWKNVLPAKRSTAAAAPAQANPCPKTTPRSRRKAA